MTLHYHRCPGCGHLEACEDCDDPEEPWYCGAWPFQSERCLELEELRKEDEAEEEGSCSS